VDTKPPSQEALDAKLPSQEALVTKTPSQQATDVKPPSQQALDVQPPSQQALDAESAARPAAEVQPEQPSGELLELSDVSLPQGLLDMEPAVSRPPIETEDGEPMDDYKSDAGSLPPPSPGNP